MTISIEVQSPAGAVQAGDVEPEIKRLNSGAYQITSRRITGRRTVAFTVTIWPQLLANLQEMAAKAKASGEE